MAITHGKRPLIDAASYFMQSSLRKAAGRSDKLSGANGDDICRPKQNIRINATGIRLVTHTHTRPCAQTHL